MDIGLFFGTFDPFHNGHLAIAGYALEYGPIDELWLVPSPHNPHKQAGSMSPFGERVAYLERVLAHIEEPRLSLTTIEDELSRPSYTYQTLMELKHRYGGHRFSIVMGGDSLATLPTWMKGEVILRDYPLLVYPRSGERQPSEELLAHGNVTLLEAPLFDISATFIRGAMAEGKRVDYFVPVGLSI